MDEAQELARRGQNVADLAKCLRDGGFSLTYIPKLLRKLLIDESWRDFETQLGRRVQHDTFTSFIVTRPLAGLGSDVSTLTRLVATDKELAGMLRQATTDDRGPKSAKEKEQRDANPLCYNEIARGTRADYGVVVLKENEPEQYAAVIAGERSVHAALLATGRRKPYVSVRIDDPASAARTLRKKLTVEQRHELARLLVEEH